MGKIGKCELCKLKMLENCFDKLLSFFKFISVPFVIGFAVFHLAGKMTYTNIKAYVSQDLINFGSEKSSPVFLLFLFGISVLVNVILCIMLRYANINYRKRIGKLSDEKKRFGVKI